MLVQKYNSIFEIDAEFIPGIEDLLEDDFINFGSLKEWSKTLDPNIHFCFVLFFNPVKNSPVGFAMLQMFKVFNENKKGLFNFFNKPTQKTYLNWEIPGRTGVGLVFNPFFEEKVIDKFMSVKQEFEKREDVIHEEIVTSSIYLQELNIIKEKYKVSPSDFIIGPLKKTFNYVEEYFHSINLEYTKEYENLISFFKENKSKIETFDSLKNIFRNKENGSDLYLNLRKHPTLSMIKNHVKNFIVITENSQIVSLIAFSQNTRKDTFVDIIHLSPNTINQVRANTYLFLIVDHFFHLEESNKMLLCSEVFDRQCLKRFNINIINKNVLRTSFKENKKGKRVEAQTA
jgi:hypothetical protein